MAVDPKRVLSRWKLAKAEKVSARPIPLDKKVIRSQAKTIADRTKAELERRYPQDRPLGNLILPMHLFKMELYDLGPMVDVQGRAMGSVTLIMGSRVEDRDPSFLLDAALGSASGKPVILMYLNGKYPVEALAKVNLEKGIYERLIHEITHLLDKKRKRNALPLVPGALDLAAYYNDPDEVRAAMQEIVDQVLENAPKLSRVFKGTDIVRPLLNLSQSWKSVGPYLNRSNQNRIMKAVYTVLQDEGYID